MKIRIASSQDFEGIWEFFEGIVRAGSTYAYPVSMTKSEAFDVWMNQPLHTYVAEEDAQILGTYYLKANFSGPAGHISNAGYMVSPLARGRGVAKAMCIHSQEMALEHGFKAMQYNCVVSSNTVAVNLWQALGFEIVGQLPRAFDHPEQGYVDVYVMYKWLNEHDRNHSSRAVS